MAALTAVTAGFNIMEGIFGMTAADAQAGALRSHLSLMRAESEADIARYAEQTQGLKAEQSVKFLKSGVTLEGSPLAILDETARVSAENISAMRAKTTADIMAAKSKISAIRGQGRAAMVGGLSRAAGTVSAYARKTAGKSSKELQKDLDNFDTSTGFDQGTYK